MGSKTRQGEDHNGLVAAAQFRPNLVKTEASSLRVVNWHTVFSDFNPGANVMSSLLSITLLCGNT